MQTFLPYADFEQSARVLDNKRLGKQRVETLQVLTALIRPNYGWQNHPAVKMWRGHFITLHEYQLAICDEWKSRGYRDTCLEKSNVLLGEFLELNRSFTVSAPLWLGNEDVHRSHRSNLVRKLPEFYRPLFEADLPDDLPYVWPLSNHTPLPDPVIRIIETPTTSV